MIETGLINGPLKYNICLVLRFTKPNEDTTGLAADNPFNNSQFDNIHLTVPARVIFNNYDFQQSLDENIEILSAKFERWSLNGSGWTLNDLRGVHLNLFR